MPSLSRRRTLRATAGFVGVLSGCGGRPESSKPTPTSDGPPSDAVTDPPTLSLRHPDGAQVVTYRDGTTSEDADPDERVWRNSLVADAETAKSVAFADVDRADRARRFLADTDFESETVYVEQRELGECYERQLCWVRWTETAVETSYVTGYRDADVACDADGRDLVAELVRLPVALDPDRVRRFSSRSASGRCRDPTSEEGSA